AAALAVDPALLAKLLGKSGEGLQLDPAVIERVVSAAQWLADGRQAGTAEQAIDMIRALGPLTRAQVGQRLVPGKRDAVLAGPAAGRWWRTCQCSATGSVCPSHPAWPPTLHRWMTPLTSWCCASCGTRAR